MTQDKKKEQLSLFDIDYFASTMRRYWLLISICMAAGLIIAFFYNEFKLPVYDVSSSILIEEERNEMPQLPNQIFQGLNLGSQNNNLQNKIQLLRSTVLIGDALNNINLQISYYHKKIFKTIELYKNSPFVVVFNQNHPQPVDIAFKIKIIDEKTFRISAKTEEVIIYSFNSGTITQILPKFKIDQVNEFGANIASEEFDFKVILNGNINLEDYVPNNFSFIIHNPKNLAKAYKSALNIEPDNLGSTVANLSIESTVPDKTIDFLNSLSDAFLAKSLEKKVHMSIKTIEYIDGQLNAIKDSLKTAEENLQKFRTSNQVMDIGSKTGRIYDQVQELEREQAATQVKYKYYEYINDYFEKNKEYSDLIAPSSMGIEDPLLNNMIQELLQLNAERISLTENNQEKSPYLKKLNIQIDNLRNTISENIKYIISTTEMALNDVKARISQLNTEINKLPKTQRELFGYERKFNLNDAIYTYLLEKRAEAEISKASYLPDAEVVETADIVGDGPFAPKKGLDLLLGLILGFIFPYGILKLITLANDKVTDRSLVEKLTTIPILGQVFNNDKKVDSVVKAFPKSHVAESFRMIRTNLPYFIHTKESAVIAITSTFGQEGKSFISLNLGISLATANLKSILLGFDLRKPKNFERLDVSNRIGISSYLSEQASIDDIIQKTNIDNLDCILSGDIPPNPSELIASSKTNDLINHLKQYYKYIIIDTPPIGIISDGFHLLNIADLILFVVRQNQTPKTEFAATINDLKEKQFKSLCIVLNDIPLIKKTKYGYDYYENKTNSIK